MPFRSSGWPLFLLVGCQEYTLGNGVPSIGGANPADLENLVQQDRILQTTTPSVDILWVVDNSSSMGPYQNALATNFPTFMDYFLDSGLDYHIGVVATEMARADFGGKLVEASTGERFITVDTQDPMQVFSEMARVGEIVGSVEKGRDAAFTALELLKDGYNEGFLRDDRRAGAHIVIISDEPDYSRSNVITIAEFSEYLNNLKDDPENVTFNSICRRLTGGDYIQVTNNVGGVLHEIEQEDWVQVLENLGFQAAGLKREYFLSRLPVVDTIEITVRIPDGAVIVFEPAEYTYSAERNSITFEVFVPEPLSEILINYTILSSVVDQG